MERFGRADYVIQTKTDVLNARGGVISQSFVSAIVTGDLQPITVKDQELIDAGEAQTGDAKFYTSKDNTINMHDLLLSDSVSYEFIKHTAQPRTGTSSQHQVWIVRRIVDES